MTSYYQHLNVAEQIWETYGPLANPFDSWRRHDVFRFEGVRIGQEAPVVRLDDDGKRELAILRWGLVPPWFRDAPADARKYQSRTFNARAETAATLSSFKDAWRKRRCLVPAKGFYEYIKPKGWKKGDKKERLIVRPKDGSPVTFAGLWSRWIGDQPPWETYTVVTCEPNALVGTIHHRMPLVVAPEDEAAWLDPDTSPEDLAALVRPAPDSLFEIAPAPRRPDEDTDEPD